MYTNIESLCAAADEKGAGIWQIALQNEMSLQGLDEQQVLSQLDERIEVMRISSLRALDAPCPSIAGLIDGVACAHQRYTAAGQTICGSFINTVMARALSGSEVNAAMGRVCAAPTAGSCGIVPAVIFTLSDNTGAGKDEVRRAFLTAGAIGAIITRNATVSGAMGGCQAECGAAAAIAAAAAVYLKGGTNRASCEACALALINCMGLICDPVAGLVQFPCAQRNASQAVAALAAADLALAGMVSIIPPDQVIESMLKVGRQLPSQLKETALGGVADTPAAKEIAARILH